MTTSRIVIMGSFLLSNFSLDVVTQSPRGLAKWQPAPVNSLLLFLLPCLLQSGHGSAAFFHHLARDLKLLQFLLAGQVEHQVEHQFFENHAQTARSHLAGHGLPCDCSESLIAEL